MGEHNCVSEYTRLDVANEYIYQIKRTAGRSTVRVFLSDAYDFGLADYLGRPRKLRSGDFILIARPESKFDGDLVERAKKDGIAIGQIGKLMGALNLNDMSSYKSPEEKEREKKREKSEGRLKIR
ncbi:hypothetical protein CWB41_14940 [Methylovirgula ligni]|nr:hypothetical protein CWB41_14940 [Methylovirgula ligni]